LTIPDGNRKRLDAKRDGKEVLRFSPITDEFYSEQEIGGYECHVEFVPSSRREEIQKEGVESGSKLDEGQEEQNSRDKKSGTVETFNVSESISNPVAWLTGSLIRR